MIKAKIGTQIHNLLENSRLGIIISTVNVTASSKNFKLFIERTHKETISSLQDRKESQFDIIKDTRSAYKICGKEPSRYRPSAEALLRRLRTKKELYEINNVVDAINLMSISTHFSIGGFDLDQIQGDIVCDVGDSEPYEAIGRGHLNIEFMPGLRDKTGFFGTPTSDSVRTMVTSNTKTLLLVFYDFMRHPSLQNALDTGINLLQSHCNGEILYTDIIQ